MTDHNILWGGCMDLKQGKKSPIKAVMNNRAEKQIANIKGNSHFKKMVLSHEKRRSCWILELENQYSGVGNLYRNIYSDLDFQVCWESRQYENFSFIDKLSRMVVDDTYKRLKSIISRYKSTGEPTYISISYYSTAINNLCRIIGLKNDIFEADRCKLLLTAILLKQSVGWNWKKRWYAQPAGFHVSTNLCFLDTLQMDYFTPMSALENENIPEFVHQGLVNGLQRVFYAYQLPILKLANEMNIKTVARWANYIYELREDDPDRFMNYEEIKDFNFISYVMQKDRENGFEAIKAD